MGEKEQQSRENRRENTAHGKVSDRRQSIILHRELLNFDRQDKRSGADRRSAKKRIKSAYILK